MFIFAPFFNNSHKGNMYFVKGKFLNDLEGFYFIFLIIRMINKLFFTQQRVNHSHKTPRKLKLPCLRKLSRLQRKSFSAVYSYSSNFWPQFCHQKIVKYNCVYLRYKHVLETLSSFNFPIQVSIAHKFSRKDP